MEEKNIQELKDPQGFSSYKEMHQWLQLVQHIEISYSAVHKRVRYGLEGKLKVSRPVHSKQEFGAPEAFKKKKLSQILITHLEANPVGVKTNPGSD